MTASASVPTLNSSGSRPSFRAAAISFSLIGRLAFAISVSPVTAQRSNPAPLPIESIVIVPAYPSSMNSSAIRSESGNTVELPAVTMFPVTRIGSTSGRPPEGPSITHAKSGPSAGCEAEPVSPRPSAAAAAAERHPAAMSAASVRIVRFMTSSCTVVRCGPIAGRNRHSAEPSMKSYPAIVRIPSEPCEKSINALRRGLTRPRPGTMSPRSVRCAAPPRARASRRGARW